MTAAAIAAGLDTTRVGRTLEVFDEIDSTNRYVLDQPPGPDLDGRVVLAEYQSAGCGRHGRRWACPRGAGLLCTIALLDPRRAIDANLLSLVVPMALGDGIVASGDVRPDIEWPNDLVVGRRKLAGVLIESRRDGPAVRYAIGFGVNCLQHRKHFPPELRATATSLDLESRRPIDRAAVLRHILRELGRWLLDPAAWICDQVCLAWKARTSSIGRRVHVHHYGQTLSGQVIDIDPTAALLVQLDEGGRRLFSVANSSVQFS